MVKFSSLLQATPLLAAAILSSCTNAQSIRSKTNIKVVSSKIDVKPVDRLFYPDEEANGCLGDGVQFKQWLEDNDNEEFAEALLYDNLDSCCRDHFIHDIEACLQVGTEDVRDEHDAGLDVVAKTISHLKPRKLHHPESSYASTYAYYYYGKSGKSTKNGKGSKSSGKSGKGSNGASYWWSGWNKPLPSKPKQPKVPQPTPTPSQEVGLNPDLVAVTMGGLLTAHQLIVPAPGSADMLAMADAFEKTILRLLDDSFTCEVYSIGRVPVHSSRKLDEHSSAPASDVVFDLVVNKPCPGCDDMGMLIMGAEVFEQTFEVLDGAAKSGELETIFCIYAGTASVVTDPCVTEISSVAGTSLDVSRGERPPTTPVPTKMYVTPAPSVDRLPTSPPPVSPPPVIPTEQPNFLTPMPGGIPIVPTGQPVVETPPPTEIVPTEQPVRTSTSPVISTPTPSQIGVQPGVREPTSYPATLSPVSPPPVVPTEQPIFLTPMPVGIPSVPTGQPIVETPPPTGIVPTSTTSVPTPISVPTRPPGGVVPTLPPDVGPVPTLPPIYTTSQVPTNGNATFVPTVTNITASAVPTVLNDMSSLAPSVANRTSSLVPTIAGRTSSAVPTNVNDTSSLVPTVASNGTATFVPTTLSLVPSVALNETGQPGALYFDGFEGGEFPVAPWFTEGNELWTISTERARTGTHSIKSGALDLLDTTPKSSNLTFITNPDWPDGSLVLSVLAGVQLPIDDFVYYVDDEFRGQLTGKTDWEQLSIPLPPGQHTVLFSYMSNPMSLEELPPSSPDHIGAVYIDNVMYLPFGITVSPTMASAPGGSVPTPPPGGALPTLPPGTASVPTLPPGVVLPTLPPGTASVPTLPPGVVLPTLPPGIGGVATPPPGGALPTLPPGTASVPTLPPGAVLPTLPPGTASVPTLPPGVVLPTLPPGIGGVPTLPPGAVLPTLPPGIGGVPTLPPIANMTPQVPTVPPVLGSVSTLLFDGFESGDLTVLEWSESGVPAWNVDETNPYEGSFSAHVRTEDIPNALDFSQLDLAVTLEEAGFVQFYFNAPVAMPFESLELWVDGSFSQPLASIDSNWTQGGVILASGDHTVSWRYTNNPTGVPDDSISTIPKPPYWVGEAWLDNVALLPSTKSFLEDWESQDFTTNNWILSGDADWTITDTNAQDGKYSATVASSEIAASSGSARLSIDIITEAGGTLTFWMLPAVSQPFDAVNVYVGDVLQFSYSSAETNWVTQDISIAPGKWEVTFELVKNQGQIPDNEISSIPKPDGHLGQVWLDAISFTAN